MPPLTPSGNQNQFFGQKVSKLGVNVNNAGDNELILKDDYSSRIYYNNNGVETVLLGLRRANSTNGIGTDQQGLFVSQDGINVTNATNSQLIFNSNQDVFKIIKKDTTQSIPSFSITVGGSGGNILKTIPHGQSFTPLINIYVASFIETLGGGGSFVLQSSSFTPLPIYGSSDANIYVFPNTAKTSYYPIDMMYAVDSTNIYIQCNCNSATNDTIAAIPITYFLLQETAN